MVMMSQFPNMTSSSILFDVVLFLLSNLVMVQVSCQYPHWFWSYDNFFLYQKSGNWKYPVWVLLNIWRLGWARNTTCGTNVSNKMLLNAANATVTAFTLSELLRENQITGKIYRKNYQEKLTFFKNKFVYFRLKFSWKSSIKF